MRDSAASEKIVPSEKVSDAVEPSPVSTTSFRNTFIPTCRSCRVPSARCTLAEPSSVSTWPMGRPATASPA